MHGPAYIVRAKSYRRKMFMKNTSADDKLQDEPCSVEEQCFGKVFCLQHVAFKANSEGVTNFES